MTYRSPPHALFALVLGLGAFGCTSPVTVIEDELVPALSEAPERPCEPDAADEPIGAGDVLLVSIDDLLRIGETHTMELTVDPAHPASLPVLGLVALVGPTTAAVREELRRRLQQEEVLRDPEVTVVVRHRQAPRVVVLGAVRSPGWFVLPRPTVSVGEALGRAGGLLPEAAELARVRGPSGDRRVDLTVAPRIVLKAGDVLEVPRASGYVVAGHVARPGEYRLGRPTTVVRALMLAGGVDATGSLTLARITRRTARGDIVSLEIDLAAIADREAPNVELQGGDVLDVPEDTARWFTARVRSLTQPLRDGGPHDDP